jgi:hypothetical protein
MVFLVRALALGMGIILSSIQLIPVVVQFIAWVNISWVLSGK